MEEIPVTAVVVEKGADSGVKVLNSHVVESPYRQKKPWYHATFKFLLLLSVMILSIYYTLSSSSLSWWESFDVRYQRFFNGTPQISLPPPYHVHPSHRENKLNASTGIQYHSAYPRNYHFIIDNTEVCKAKTHFLVLMVPVATHDMASRDAIRRTWGKETVVQGELVRTLFMLGLPGGDDAQQQQGRIGGENLLYHDIIQSNFMDTYLNLTIKTMVIMDWLATHCAKAAYAMKIDADMFLNIDNLVLMLKKPGIPKVNYLTGMLMWNRPVIRSKDSKWYVPEEMFPDPVYPTYALGMGYVFSNDLPKKFVEASESIKPFNIEDAYIGMCMKKLGLSLTGPPDPSQFKSYNSRYDRCEFSRVITYILGSSKQLVDYWTDLKKPGSPC